MAAQLLLDTYGLDKDARNAAIREAQESEALTVPPLDPPFPYVCKPFNPLFFGLDKNPNLVPAASS